MKISEAQQYIKESVSAIYADGEAEAIALLVLEEELQQDRNSLLLHKEQELLPQALINLHQYIQRLQHHEPVQYIFTKAWFYGLELYVDEAVLIPRPETEELVDWIIKDLKPITTPLKILDIGTGSGCIALALKQNRPLAEVWGCDVSEEALNVARRNCAALNIRVDFQGLDFLQEEQHDLLPSVDIIVSNPPYIPLQDKQEMKANVIDYEPHKALFVPDNDALVFYKAIAKFARQKLHHNGSIYLEIHEELGPEVTILLNEEGFKNVEVRKDMQGKNRMVKALRSFEPRRH